MSIRNNQMTLVTVGNNEFTDLIGTRGFGGQGASKFGAILQAGRLGYRVAKFGYKRYFGYATRTRSRTIGTSVGAGLGIGGGLVTVPSTEFTPSNQNGQTRAFMVKPSTKRFGSRYKRTYCYRRPKRR